MILNPLVLFLTLASAAVQQTPAKATLPGARNVTRVDAVVMCGGATTAEAYPALKQEGFSSVINLRNADEPGVDIGAARAAAESAGLLYIHIPVSSTQPDVASVDAFLRAVTDKKNQPMYIHCGSANRVGAMWMIKRVVVDGWDVQRATSEAEAIGLSNPALKQFATDYATTHRKK